MQRKLTTILAADLIGYSRLMAADEEGMINRLSDMQAQIVLPALEPMDGRIFKTMGDGFLAEFTSPVSAVRAALRIQDSLCQSQTEAPEDQKLKLRIGIHLGDVVVRQDDLFGDAVNIAARLESIAQPYGICVSRAIKEQSSRTVSAVFTSLGAKTLKNLPEPIEVWAVQTGGQTGTKIESTRDNSGPRLLIAEFLATTTDLEMVALATGVAEDVAGALAGAIVVLRQDREKEEDAAVAARQAQATHILDGTLRKFGGRVRLSATLRSAKDGEVSWTRRYDETINDLFDLQDRLAIAIAQETGAALFEETFGLTLRAEGTSNLDAWRHYSEALPDLRDPFDVARRARAGASLAKALALDPEFVAAWAAKTNVAYADFRATGRTEAIAEAHSASRRALDLAPDSAVAWSARSRAYLMDKEYDNAVAAAQKAASLAPEEVAFAVNHAMLLDRAGAPEQALRVAQRATSLDPLAVRGRLGQVTGLALLSLQRHREAADQFAKVINAGQDWRWARLYHAIAAYLAEAETEAIQSYDQFREQAPDFDVEAWDHSQLHKSESLRIRRAGAARALEQQWQAKPHKLR